MKMWRVCFHLKHTHTLLHLWRILWRVQNACTHTQRLLRISTSHSLNYFFPTPYFIILKSTWFLLHKNTKNYKKYTREKHVKSTHASQNFQAKLYPKIVVLCTSYPPTSLCFKIFSYYYYYKAKLEHSEVETWP